VNARTHLSISAISYDLDEQGITVVNDRLNRASGDRRLELDSQAPVNVLRLRGVITHVINHRSDTMLFLDRLTNPREGNLATQLPSLWASMEMDAADLDQAARGFFMTTVAGRIATAQGAVSAATEPLCHFCAYMQSEAVPGFELSANETHNGDARRYLANIQVCNERCLFTTTGGYLDLGPRSTQVGDVVCVLFGGTVPFVLRRSGDDFRLHGEAYVYGVMNGEVIDQLDAGNITAEWITLV
jgi:hypothetical protein